MGGDAGDEQPLDPTTDWAREHLHRYVATDGADGHEWRPGVYTLLLTSRGRRSGMLRRTPLIYGRDGDRYVVVASKGGAPRNPGWLHNLRAGPDATIQVGPDVMPARAAVAEGAERERLWGEMTGIWPDFDAYQARTERRIPVVTLEPVGA
jgi:deazaflavin-dependent oxidoreductase (nitroreductase family)